MNYLVSVNPNLQATLSVNVDIPQLSIEQLIELLTSFSETQSGLCSTKQNPEMNT